MRLINLQNLFCRETNNTANIKSARLPVLLLTGIGLLSQNLYAASCEFSIPDNWNTGFKTEIIIQNDDTAKNDWTLNLTWPEGVSINNGWNATYSCTDTGCTITKQNTNSILNPNERLGLGFVASRNGYNGEIELTLSGDICDGVTGTSPGSDNANDGNNSEDNQIDTGLWSLNGDTSLLTYVSVKKLHTAEVNEFQGNDVNGHALSGSIDLDGNVVLAVNLNNIETGVDIRNSRVVDLLFATELLPTAYFTTQIDTSQISAMPTGDIATQTVTGDLTIHGVSQPISLDLLVTKLGVGTVKVSTLRPLVVNSNSFDMAYGIEALRVVAGLSGIGETVPVYFDLQFTSVNTNDFVQTKKAEAPIAPDSLVVQYEPSDNQAHLNWRDNSNNETSYLVRRQALGGDWHTVAELAASATLMSEGLPDTGEFNYKVIALNQSVPSLPTEAVTVTVTETNAIARGMEQFNANCAGCHGSEGGGLGSFPALNTERNVDAMIETIARTMPYSNPASCDQQCAEDIAAYIQTLWPTTLTCDVGVTPVAYGARQLKILTQREYQNTVEDLLNVDYHVADGLSPDSQVGFFTNNTHTSVLSTTYNNYLLVAEELAQWSANQSFSNLLSCAAIDESCASALITDVAPKIFRRPLTPDEQSTYESIALGTFNGGDIAAGMQLALEGLLSSPQFIYRHELGEANLDNPELDNDAFELTSYEMATFLAYTFTGTTPDDELLAAAANDELRDEDKIMQHAARLASSAEGVLADFIGSWLGTADLEVAAKDETLYPNYQELVPHMKAELNKTFAWIMMQQDERFESLYTANYTFLNETLANHYGIAGVTGQEMQKIDTSNRGGILANGAFMARWAEAAESHPVIRSVRVRRRMLCQDQPDPPAGTFAARDEKLAELSEFLQQPTTTNRAKYHALTVESPCSSCHAEYINPLGFGMEDFDAVGNIRSSDIKGNQIDASGALYAPESYADLDSVFSFYGTQGLANLMAGLDSSQTCLTQQMFRYAIGVGHNEIDPNNPEDASLSETEHAGYLCEIDTLKDKMANESPRAMLENFGYLKSVRYRKAWSRDE
ncbi:DUF1592 domain-containing protein [Catenovulum maritimum]|uniref:Peptide chain release factor 2 n=1 Tax=Catenovulum maritimum TaxID=1513271 RepID=A0A0J8GS77_9ALTE|nr:DUF1592 domain-containing protein [Catenovulum maritimum]KMT64154.1 peptide chain release factor 2 [Catenovulum maritimum]